ncbi:hypothetical protein TNCV_4115171 [Trichonephila clavipes]|nr:hypothetical protein TNCV_4115171 [Trichonephila clavipes]
MRYSPDVSSRYFHRFRHLKHSLGGKRFSDNEERKAAVNCCLSNQVGDVFEEGFQNLILRTGMAVSDVFQSGRPIFDDFPTFVAVYRQ